LSNEDAQKNAENARSKAECQAVRWPLGSHAQQDHTYRLHVGNAVTQEAGKGLNMVWSELFWRLSPQLRERIMRRVDFILSQRERMAIR
jgi:hypothetical protein